MRFKTEDPPRRAKRETVDMLGIGEMALDTDGDLWLCVADNRDANEKPAYVCFDGSSGGNPWISAAPETYKIERRVSWAELTVDE